MVRVGMRATFALWRSESNDQSLQFWRDGLELFSFGVDPSGVHPLRSAWLRSPGKLLQDSHRHGKWAPCVAPWFVVAS